MGKKKALRALVFQEILSSKARFISIMLLIVIGVSFFAGINASGPDMLKTAVLYYQNQNLMDMRVVSTMGLEEEDIDILKQQEDIEQIEATYSQDVVTQKEDQLLKIYSYQEDNVLNQFEVVSGRLPKTSGEIALLSSDKIQNIYQINDTVTFVPDSEDTNLSEQFKKTQYTVVGFVKSPLYVTDKQLGSSAIGKGSLDGYGVIRQEDFDLPVYTEVYLTFHSLVGMNPYSKEYEDKIEQYEEEIKSAFTGQGEIRLLKIKEDAQKELADGKQEIADGKQELEDGLTKLEDAKKEIEDGKKQIKEAQDKLADARVELEKGQSAYEENKVLFEEQIEDARNQLAMGANQLASGQGELDENKKKVEEGRKQIEDGLSQIEEQKSSLTLQKEQLEGLLSQIQPIFDVPIEYVPSDQKDALIQAGDAISLGENQTLGDLWRGYFSGALSKDVIVSSLEGILSQLEEGLKTIEGAKEELLEKQEELKQAKQQIAAGQEQINTGNDTIITKSAEFEEKKAEGEAKLADAKKQIEDGFKELEDGAKELEEQKQKLIDGEVEYEEGLAEYEEKSKEAKQDIADAEKEIKKAQKELDDLKEPTYYAFSRVDNPGYSEYADNADRLSALSIIFPAFFFAIAALVSLTTITRMIEEQRVQIGTLKAQGYTDSEISIKYYVYALGASGLGAIFGLLGGFYGIPRIIINAYGSMYNFPNRQYEFYVWIALISVGISVFCTGISVWAVLRQELKGSPSILMRPKAPKVGKRILFERITPIWKRLSFVQKVTMRNLFRYKQRMIMTVFGIAGCMGLMMTGFGLNDSISDISTLQFKTILRYQALVVFDEDASKEKQEEAKTALSKQEGLTDFLMVRQEQYEVKQSGVNTQQAYVIVPQQEEPFANYVHLRNQQDKTVYNLSDEGAIITKKLAQLFNVEEGDMLTLTNSDNETFEVLVSKVAENYVGHYIYMSPEVYRKYFKSDEMTYNGALLLYDQDKSFEENLSSTLNQYGAIRAIAYNSSSIETFDSAMGSLTAVVLVLIISAAVLAFVVLYNLTNINVSERIRELSTIKVLGFYDQEVTMYIYRENIILSVFGIVLGSFLGKFLHYFVLDTASMDNMMFSSTLHTASYVYAGILTLIFSTMVMWVMHNKLKHVDMIEALKSNE